MTAPLRHDVVGGFCRICGETEEWILYGPEGHSTEGVEHER